MKGARVSVLRVRGGCGQLGISWMPQVLWMWLLAGGSGSLDRVSAEHLYTEMRFGGRLADAIVCCPLLPRKMPGLIGPGVRLHMLAAALWWIRVEHYC